jgi:hypothetical protein
MCNRYGKWNGTISIACCWRTALHTKCRVCHNQRSIVLSSIFISFHMGSHAIYLQNLLPLWCVWTLLMQLLSITQGTNGHLMLLLLCRERQGSLVSWCLHGVCISFPFNSLQTAADNTAHFLRYYCHSLTFSNKNKILKILTQTWKWSMNCRSGSWCWYWIREVQVDGERSPWLLCMPSTLKAYIDFVCMHITLVTPSSFFVIMDYFHHHISAWHIEVLPNLDALLAHRAYWQMHLLLHH